MGQKQHYVAIKGTKDGLTLHLDDTCSFNDLIQELEDKLSSSTQQEEERPLVVVRLEVGNRFLTNKQEEKLRDLIRNKKNLVVESIHSNVITKDEAKRLKEESQITTVAKMVRSGQVLQVKGDLLLIGDVNPGGKVVAGGNVFIMGTLKGIAHAGCFGNDQAIIAASSMKPSQLRIAEIISRAPDHSDGTSEMECAYISEQTKHIVTDRLQVLIQLRPQLNRFKLGGM